MIPMVSERPYEFLPPYHGRFWTTVLGRLLRPYLKWQFGIERLEFIGLERLRASHAAGHGILLTPNHPRPCDPFVMGQLSIELGPPFFMMASWHLFLNGGWQAWALHRLGAFSIYREGMDKASIQAAIGILESAERPLVIFPEGYISLANDRLNPLLEGTSFVARTAAKKRAARSPLGKVVVHPVALRYRFHGEIMPTVDPVLTEFEKRFTLRPAREMSLFARVARLGIAVLALKELEHMGRAGEGPLEARLTALTERLLGPLEGRYLGGDRTDYTPERVRKLRSAILPLLRAPDLSSSDRERMWRELEDCYLAQQLCMYPSDYLHETASPDRILETVERLEEDITDKIRTHRPRSVSVEIGPALEVSPERERGGEDPVLAYISRQLEQMLQISGATAAPLR